MREEKGNFMKNSTGQIEEDLTKKINEIGMWGPEIGRNESGMYWKPRSTMDWSA